MLPRDIKLEEGFVSSLDVTITFSNLGALSGNAMEKEQRLSPWVLSGSSKAAWELQEEGPFPKSGHIRELWGGQESKKGRGDKWYLHDNFIVLIIASLF